MPAATRLSTYDHQTGQVRLRISLWHLLVLALAKAADTVTTVVALWLAPGLLMEAQPVTASLIGRLGLVEGTLVVGWLAVAGVAALAELAGASLEAVRQRTGAGAAWLPYDVTAFTYYLAASWFALLAVSNTWVLASALGVLG